MFTVGTGYSRTNLITFAGSEQPRSGIIWGDGAPECVLITSGGRHAKSAGYQDMRRADGCWEYHGQGVNGDQDPKRFANRLLIEGTRTVLLFTTREPTASEARAHGTTAKQYVFEGCFGVAAWHRYAPSVGKRKGDFLLRFLLAPCSLEVNEVDAIPVYEDVRLATLDQLRALIDNTFGTPATAGFNVCEYRYRSALVKRYVSLRADGICEHCERPAPFLRTNGDPYLEAHHILRLADDGPDHPRNVIALCPNCHREAHCGAGRDGLRVTFLKISSAKEQLAECFHHESRPA